MNRLHVDELGKARFAFSVFGFSADNTCVWTKLNKRFVNALNTKTVYDLFKALTKRLFNFVHIIHALHSFT